MLFNLPFVQYLTLKWNVISQCRVPCRSLKWVLGPTRGRRRVVGSSGLAQPLLRGGEWGREGASAGTRILSAVLSIPRWLRRATGSFLFLKSNFAHNLGQSPRPTHSKTWSNPEHPGWSPEAWFPREVKSPGVDWQALIRCTQTRGSDFRGPLSPPPGCTSLIFWWCLVHFQRTNTLNEKKWHTYFLRVAFGSRIGKNSIKTWLKIHS